MCICEVCTCVLYVCVCIYCRTLQLMITSYIYFLNYICHYNSLIQLPRIADLYALELCLSLFHTKAGDTGMDTPMTGYWHGWWHMNNRCFTQQVSPQTIKLSPHPGLNLFFFSLQMEGFLMAFSYTFTFGLWPLTPAAPNYPTLYPRMPSATFIWYLFHFFPTTLPIADPFLLSYILSYSIYIPTPTLAFPNSSHSPTNTIILFLFMDE